MTLFVFPLQIILEILVLVGTFSLVNHYNFINRIAPKQELFSTSSLYNSYDIAGRDEKIFEKHSSKEELDTDWYETPYSRLANSVYNLFSSSWLPWWKIDMRNRKKNEQLKQEVSGNNIISNEKQIEAGDNSFEAQDTESEISSLQKQAMGNTANYLVAKAIDYASNQDYDLAVKFLTQATKFGSPVANYNLGLLYFKGLGVDKDYKIALNHFTTASVKGHVKSIENVKLLQKRMKLLNT